MGGPYFQNYGTVKMRTLCTTWLKFSGHKNCEELLTKTTTTGFSDQHENLNARELQPPTRGFHSLVGFSLRFQKVTLELEFWVLCLLIRPIARPCEVP